MSMTAQVSKIKKCIIKSNTWCQIILIQTCEPDNFINKSIFKNIASKKF